MRNILTTLALVTAIPSLHAQVPSYVPSDGLVGWWPFDGNANDESGNGNNGTVTEAVLTTDRFGNAQAAYDFNGQALINAGALANFGNSNAEISQTGWFRTNANEFCKMPIITKRHNTFTGNGWATVMFRYGNMGYLNFVVDDHFYANGIDNPLSTEPVEYNDGEWHHFAAIKDQSNYSLYIDGQLVDSGEDTYDFGLSSNDLIFGFEGAFGFVCEQYYTGQLDDLGIWNRALTPAEVQELFSAQPPAPCISPIPVSFSGLNSSYLLVDAPTTLNGTPTGGVFIGPGVSGNTFNPLAAGIGSHSIQYVVLDANNCVNSAGQCTEVTVTTGVDGSQISTGGVRVFPNPNRGQFTVELDLVGLVGMQIVDARGRTVHNEVFTASGSLTQRTLDLSAFAKGSYTLLVQHEGQRITQTVIVE